MARRGALVLLFVLLGLLAATPASAYNSAGPIAVEIQNLFWAITVFAVIVAIVVFGALLIFLVRYREAVSPRPTTWIEGNRRVEMVWTVVPTIILIVILIISVPVLVYTDTLPTPDTTVTVIGTQFVWNFTYEDRTSSSPDLWIQAGIVVRLEVTSLDVIHSFTVPDLGVKIDALPGHMNHWWMQADTPGDYLIQCAELCGVGHYGMRGIVHVFAAGTQPKIYGPPPKIVPVTDVYLRETGGNVSQPWTIVPKTLTYGIGADIRLRIWNNATSTAHDFSIDAPISESIPPIPPLSYAWLNFTLTTPSPTPVPYGPTNPADRANGMEGLFTVQAGNVIRIDLDDGILGGTHTWSVSPNPLVLNYSKTYTFEIHNIGSVAHNFTMDAPYAFVKHDLPIAPGTFAFAGPYTFNRNATGIYRCSIHPTNMLAPYIVGSGSVAAQGLPLFDMVAITIAVSAPVTLAYVIHHARRRDED